MLVCFSYWRDSKAGPSTPPRSSGVLGRRGREYLGFCEQGEAKDLVTRDRVPPAALLSKRMPVRLWRNSKSCFVRSESPTLSSPTKIGLKGLEEARRWDMRSACESETKSYVPCLFKSGAIEYKQQSFRTRVITPPPPRFTQQPRKKTLLTFLIWRRVKFLLKKEGVFIFLVFCPKKYSSSVAGDL